MRRIFEFWYSYFRIVLYQLGINRKTEQCILRDLIYSLLILVSNISFLYLMCIKFSCIYLLNNVLLYPILISFVISLLVSVFLLFLALNTNPVDITLIELSQIIFILIILFVFTSILSRMSLNVMKHTHLVLVFSQLSCFLFNFKYDSERARLLLNVLFIGIFGSYISLTETWAADLTCFSMGLLLLIILFLSLPQYLVHGLIYILLMTKASLLEWCFYLAFQQIIYFVIMYFYKIKTVSGTKKHFFLYLILALLQTIVGYFSFGIILFLDVVKLAGLVSGAIIISLCVERVDARAFRHLFFIYFFISLFIGISLTPSEPELLIYGISRGLFSFVCIHLLFYAVFLIFRVDLPKSFVSWGVSFSTGFPNGNSGFSPIGYKGLTFLSFYYPVFHVLIRKMKRRKRHTRSESRMKARRQI